MPTTLHRLREFFIMKVMARVLIGIERLIGRMSLVGNPAVFDNTVFPWTRRLEENWEAIRDELRTILAFHDELPALQDIQQEQRYITTDNKWKTFFLYGYGTKSELNCAKCPRTAALLEEVPGMLSGLFSILGPGKHIPRHRGVFSGIIRAHLGLIVPGRRCECRMQIGDELICWEEGRMVVFDNTYYHEVWNDTGELRAVLMIDIVRPFAPPFSWLNRGIIRLIGWSSYVREAMRRHRTWEERFDAVFRKG